MKFFKAEKIRKADEYTIKHEPVKSVDLMERAAKQMAVWLTKKYSKVTSFKIFCGTGNNGGDGWALARLLYHSDYRRIELFLLKTDSELSPDSQINQERLIKETNIAVHTIKMEKDFPSIRTEDHVIDALFGSGLSRAIEGLAAKLIEHINKSKKSAVIAVDIPSGLFGEDNSGKRNCIVRASLTLTFQFPKLSFFFPENNEFVGEWHVLPIGLHPDFIRNESSPYRYTLEEDVLELLKIRQKFSHKGTYGHGLLIAGCYGMMGAAVLAARAALRAGAGLITSHVPRFGLDIMQKSVPEVLVSIDESDLIFTRHPALEKYSAIGVGPGLNSKPNTRKGFLRLLKSCNIPIVIDADGLNILAETEKWQSLIPDRCILTPHPKEFERLFGVFDDSYSRMKAQVRFSKQKKCIVILKGAYTCLTTKSGEVWFNSTGNPGMATGGSGDVLTGIILGLLSQGYSPRVAAIMGVYLHGAAGDIASDFTGENSLTASDISDNIGRVFNVLEKKKKKSQ